MAQISVVMPTYNTPVGILKEATESILGQTFRDFEFIIVDDGSTNDPRSYLEGLADERIRLIRNPENIGITKSLNIGFSAARGKYIARMDADDISLPERLEKQLAFMERHPDVIVCGSAVRDFGAVDRVAKVRRTNVDMERYRIAALFGNPGPYHPTAFFNRELLLRHGLKYDEKLVYAQDYGLWVQIGRCGRVCNLKDVLLLRRVHANQISGARRESQIRCDQMTQRKLLEALLGEVTEEELTRHYRWSAGVLADAVFDGDASAWYRRLIAANDGRGVYDRRKLRRYVYGRILRRLILNTLPQDATGVQKTKAFFRHLPFGAALYATAEECARMLASVSNAGKNRGKGASSSK